MLNELSVEMEARNLEDKPEMRKLEANEVFGTLSHLWESKLTELNVAKEDIAMFTKSFREEFDSRDLEDDQELTPEAIEEYTRMLESMTAEEAEEVIADTRRRMI